MPEQQPHSHAKLFLWLGLLVLALLVLSGVAYYFTAPPQAGPVTSETIRMGEAPRPAFTEATKEKVRASTGFQALVSYTDRGFEPTNVRIQAGQTVRFTNNSSATLSLRTGNMQATIAPQDFYEHTYPAAGVFEYRGGTATGIVQVQ